jgi:hypothetical protein
LLGSKIRIGSLEDDTRFHFFGFMKSGYGKQEGIKIIRRSAAGLSFSLPTGHHAEQLLGKVLFEDEKKRTGAFQNRGYLWDNYLSFDDCHDLLVNPRNEESRRYLLQAMNIYPDNIVTKGGVNVRPEERMAYPARASIALFAQPHPLPESIVTSGFLRRAFIVYPPTSRDERLCAFTKSFESTLSNEKDWEIWLTHLHNLGPDDAAHFRISNDIKNKMRDRLTERITWVLGHESPKIANFADNVLFNLKSNLAKMASFRAIDRLAWKGQMDPIGCGFSRECEILETDLEAAIDDFEMFWKETTAFISEKVSGGLSYRNVEPKGEAKYVPVCLAILKDRNCTAESTSTLSIEDFKKEIANVMNCSYSNAKRIYDQLKHRNLIDSKQLGSYGSVVWLTSDPKS